MKSGKVEVRNPRPDGASAPLMSLPLAAQVVTYRGPAGAYMHRRVRQGASEETSLDELLGNYDNLVAEQVRASAVVSSRTDSEQGKLRGSRSFAFACLFE